MHRLFGQTQHTEKRSNSQQNLSKLILWYHNITTAYPNGYRAFVLRVICPKCGADSEI